MSTNKALPEFFHDSELSFEAFRKVVLNDYKIAYESRQVSLLGRKEVLNGRAKFGIFGDGKEIAQVAMAKMFKEGDWRAGYYRDQTFMFATGMSTITAFFAQLYANPNVAYDPASAGRQMNSHFATRSLNEDGSWKVLTQMKNSSSDISTTAGHLGRLLGLAHASKLYRQNPELSKCINFSKHGNEVAFGSIGNASTSQGIFWEAFNAASVLQVPFALSVWDDAYGISVPAKLQTTKEDISEILSGFQSNSKGKGYEIFKVFGWDYPGLCQTYQNAIGLCRQQHTPVFIHVVELTQPLGHSTSGSHERYKSHERLQWEKEFDCLVKMRAWMLEAKLASDSELEDLEHDARRNVRSCQKKAWEDYIGAIQEERNEALSQLLSYNHPKLKDLANQLQSKTNTLRKDITGAIRKAILVLSNDGVDAGLMINWYRHYKRINQERYNSKLFSTTSMSPLKLDPIPAAYDANCMVSDGRQVLNACFDANLSRDPSLVIFGEDVGVIGDVNQGLAGLQTKHGDLRIFDTGIRESTIVGEAIGLALRGLKPIAEIQYLDYLVYGLNTTTDDLASLSYRTKGGQKAPVIIRTRGHRLEGIWHSGSPMGMILGSLRGLHVCVPRNMTQAAGLYNTLLQGDEPALVIECLNGYRLKEKIPTNIGEFRVALGQAEIIREGTDLTVISYGSTLRIVQEAAESLSEMGIHIEIVDPQTLLPFDIGQISLKSLSKTNKLLVVDEDVPGGASAFILQQVVEKQKGYFQLDAQPRTLTAKEHRPAYGSDGDYFTKPSVDDVVELVYEMMHAGA